MLNKISDSDSDSDSFKPVAKSKCSKIKNK